MRLLGSDLESERLRWEIIRFPSSAHQEATSRLAFGVADEDRSLLSGTIGCGKSVALAAASPPSTATAAPRSTSAAPTSPPLISDAGAGLPAVSALEETGLARSRLLR